VRELENVLERAAVLYADADGAVDERELRNVIPELFGKRRRGGADGQTLRSVRNGNDREHVRRVLADCGGDQAEAAKRLGIGRTTLWRKLRAEA
jgi:propionate catabolism operon transcriptional regulator